MNDGLRGLQKLSGDPQPAPHLQEDTPLQPRACTRKHVPSYDDNVLPQKL